MTRGRRLRIAGIRRHKVKKESRDPQTHIMILTAIGLLIIIIAALLFLLLPQIKTLTPGTITGLPQDEYRVPVGGTVTINYQVNTWNGVEWNWPDLDKYQYNYNLINMDTGYIIARGTSWRLIHQMPDSITLKMNRDGTFNYTLRETVDFLLEGRTVNGTAKDFVIIVGTGINPEPTPKPTTGTGGTFTVQADTIPEEATVVSTPATTITFAPYVPGATPTPQAAIRVTPQATTEPLHPQITATIKPTTASPQDDSGLTFVPAATDTPEPEKKTLPGFEIIFILAILYVFRRK